jgi:amino acid permease
LENIASLVANYGVSAIVVVLFVWDWVTNKKKITESLEEMKVSNSNTAKSLELLQKSMENQEQTLAEIKNNIEKR